MSADLRLFNHQRTRKLDLRRLRKAVRVLLGELLNAPDYDLAVHFVNALEMAKLNQKHLGHEGSTDVITLDYVTQPGPHLTPALSLPFRLREDASARQAEGAERGKKSRVTGQIAGSSVIDASRPVCGEIFVCVDEAQIQARRFRVPWTTEVARYVVHAILHLQGHDDHAPAARRHMKREETRLLRELGRRFHLSELVGKTKLDA